MKTVRTMKPMLLPGYIQGIVVNKKRRRNKVQKTLRPVIKSTVCAQGRRKDIH